jgi:hypothetical protein
MKHPTTGRGGSRHRLLSLELTINDPRRVGAGPADLRYPLRPHTSHLEGGAVKALPFWRPLPLSVHHLLPCCALAAVPRALVYRQHGRGTGRGHPAAASMVTGGRRPGFVGRPPEPGLAFLLSAERLFVSLVTGSRPLVPSPSLGTPWARARVLVCGSGAMYSGGIPSTARRSRVCLWRPRSSSGTLLHLGGGSLRSGVLGRE